MKLLSVKALRKLRSREKSSDFREENNRSSLAEYIFCRITDGKEDVTYARIYVDFAKIDQIGNCCKSVASKVDAVQSDLQHIIRQLDWDVRFESNINSTATQIARKLELYSKALENYQRFIEDAHSEYTKLDEYKKLNITAQLDPRIHHVLGPGGQLQIFTDEFWSNYGWKEILSGAGYIGTIYT